MKVAYMCHGLKIGGLGSGPFLKTGGFQNWSTCEKGGFGAKTNKETYIFFEKEDLLHQSKKWSL